MSSSVAIYNDSRVPMSAWWQCRGGGRPWGGYRETVLQPGDDALHGFTLALPMTCALEFRGKRYYFRTFSPPRHGRTRVVNVTAILGFDPAPQLDLAGLVADPVRLVERRTFLELADDASAERRGFRRHAKSDDGVTYCPRQPEPTSPAESADEAPADSWDDIDVDAAIDLDRSLVSFEPAPSSTSTLPTIEASVAESTKVDKEWTTVVLKQLPQLFSQMGLCQILDSVGFAKTYDFVYAPVDFKTRGIFGYCFINFINHTLARNALDRLGSCFCSVQGLEAVEVHWSEQQGLRMQIERYRNSPVMHRAIPDTFKPMLFRKGVRATFPRPTKSIKPPSGWFRKTRISGKVVPESELEEAWLPK